MTNVGVDAQVCLQLHVVVVEAELEAQTNRRAPPVSVAAAAAAVAAAVLLVPCLLAWRLVS